ncbi:hypothetical protein UPYG_G00255390 [Umbra pygmaea]|uniref:Uncharacterized protein n=1 Tax=Umbra pygmaea TaxID=75934 RepID=A0ABD0WTS8_UMBPY
MIYILAVGVAVGMAVGMAVGAAVCVIAAVMIIHQKDENERPADDSLSLNALNHQPKSDNEDKSQSADSITYASIGNFNQNPPQKVDAHGEDTVTYASVMTSSDRERILLTTAPSMPLDFKHFSMTSRQ